MKLVLITSKGEPIHISFDKDDDSYYTDVLNIYEQVLDKDGFKLGIIDDLEKDSVMNWKYHDSWIIYNDKIAISFHDKNNVAAVHIDMHKLTDLEKDKYVMIVKNFNTDTYKWDKTEITLYIYIVSLLGTGNNRSEVIDLGKTNESLKNMYLIVDTYGIMHITNDNFTASYLRNHPI